MTPRHRTNILALAGALHGLLSLPLYAQNPSFAQQGSSGDLKFIAAMTNDPNWFEEWNNPTSGTPKLSGSTIVRRGDEMHFVFIFSGATSAAEGAQLDCALILSPPGAPQPLAIERAPCYQKPIPDPSRVYLAEFFPKIDIPKDVPPGPFRATATMWDNLSGNNVSVDIAVEVE